jgi:hypothetical protein
VGAAVLLAVGSWIVVFRSLLVLLDGEWRAVDDRVYRALWLVLPASPPVTFAAGASVMNLAVIVIVAGLEDGGFDGPAS